MRFMGKPVHFIKGYPVITISDHPVSTSGYAYVHRVVAYDVWGSKVLEDGIVVHHKNGDKRDWRRSNLELMNLADHTAVHNKNTGVGRACDVCWAKIRATQGQTSPANYCSVSCRSLGMRVSPRLTDKEVLRIVSAHNVNTLARHMGVSWHTAKKYADRIIGG